MNKIPTVSICITTYNRYKELEITLNSILAQTYRDFELIISDDCSTDSTEQLCLEFQKKDSRIKYYKNSANLKMPGNLNSAISKARGAFIANLHDGDIYRSDLIEKWHRALINNPEAAFVFNDYSEYSSTFGDKQYSLFPIENGFGQLEIAKHYFNTLTSCVWGTVMARKETYEKYGPFNEKYGFISDVEMWLRICSKEKFAYINEYLIVLTPREKNHRYFLPDWQHKFWDFLILKETISMYSSLMPKESRKALKSYKLLLLKEFYKSMIILIKHNDFYRVKQGLSIWRDSPYLLLRIWAYIFRSSNYPDWYKKDFYWAEICNPKLS